MKNLLRSSRAFWLFLLWSKFLAISMLTTEDNTCDNAQEDTLAMIQWYTQVYNFTKTNYHVTQHIMDVQSQLDQLERKIENNHKKMATTINHTIEEKFLQMDRKLEASRKSMQEAHNKLEQCLKASQSQNANENIVIQRRQDGSVDFYRTWTEYKQGFGNSSGEFFIGLEKLHKLTNSRPYELLVVMEDFENDRRYALYDQFIIASEVEKYALKQLGKYSGSAGDSMAIHLGQKFSTKDQDNDLNSGSCAELFTGAWWYKDCHQSNLNGRYLRGKHTEYAQGVNWLDFRGHYYSLKFVEMIIRPR